MKTFKQKNDGQYNSKANTVCLLKILEAYSDGNIILPMSRIIELMESTYGLHVDRRTVYSSIDILQQLKYPIETYEDNGIGYCMTNKPLDVLDVKLLIDSLSLNTVVPKKYEEDIKTKLIKLMPNEDTKHFMNRIVGSLKKEADMNLFYTLDTIDLAMYKKKKIEFDYLTKDIALTHFVLTPMTITQINYHYYLICSNPDEKQNIIFRVKDIKNIKISDMPSSSYTYLKGFAMLNQTGECFDYIHATLKCSSDIEDLFIDTFDNFLIKNRKIVYSDNKMSFTSNVYGTIESISRWALAYPDKCEVIEPQEIRDMIIDKIKNNIYGV